MKELLLRVDSGQQHQQWQIRRYQHIWMNMDIQENNQIEQCQVSELAEKGKSADFAIATTVVGANMPCPVLPGLPLLTGVGADKLFSDVEEQMNK